MVNGQVARIFNGVLEAQKSAKKPEVIAEILQKKTAHSCVYHVHIYHNPATIKLSTSLRCNAW